MRTTVKFQKSPKHPWTVLTGDEAKHVVTKMDVEPLTILVREFYIRYQVHSSIRLLNGKSIPKNGMLVIIIPDNAFAAQILNRKKSKSTSKSVSKPKEKATNVE